MALIAAFIGDLFACKPKDVAACCSCKDDREILTKAWIDSLEQVSVLGAVGSNTAAVEPIVEPGKSPSPKVESPTPADSSPESNSSWPLRGGLDKLRVPSEFEGARHGVLRPVNRQPLSPGSDASASPESSNSAEEQRRCLQASLRAFTKSLLHGISVSVLLDDGRTRLAEARLDSELTHLVLHVPNAQHPVALTCIESVSTPDEAWATSGEMPGQAYIDERCSTLVISGGQFLTFVFDTPRTREYFEMCLKVLILAKESRTTSTAQETSRSGKENAPELIPSFAEGGAGVVPSSGLSTGFPAPLGPGLGTVPESVSEAESDEWFQTTGSPDSVISRT